jgi:hypothetical protein
MLLHLDARIQPAELPGSWVSTLPRQDITQPKFSPPVSIISWAMQTILLGHLVYVICLSGLLLPCLESWVINCNMLVSSTGTVVTVVM